MAKELWLKGSPCAKVYLDWSLLDKRIYEGESVEEAVSHKGAV